MPVQQILQNFFLNPLGLAALTATVPIIIFYLTRPEPEKKVMPSMEFFQQDERKSRLKNALRKLQNNLLLLTNLFFILLLSLGAAGLYLQNHGEQESVIIYDRSASMHEEHAEAVSTVLSQASPQNTVIITGENLEIHEDLDRQAAADLIREKPPTLEESNLAAALQHARIQEGRILLLSNIDTQKSTVDGFKELGEERGLQQIEYSTENHHGIREVSEDHVEIKNYRPLKTEITVEINSNEKQVELRPEELKQVEVDLKEGRNTVELPQDGFSPDNKAYIKNPGDKKIQVEYYGPENRYLTTALEEISGVEKSSQGDIAVLNEENSQVYNSDKPKILMQGSSPHWKTTETSEEPVRFQPPYNVKIDAQMYNLTSTADSFTTPEKALFREKDNYYYNVQDENFRHSVVYPVVWKDMINDLDSGKSFEASNTEIRNSKFNETGFQDGKAVNFLSEPRTEFVNVESASSSTLKENQASTISLLLLLLLSAETLLILDRGVYR
ncbi:MAG: vWA domain-containing protein [Candidatus Nanohaloarchaea archaeon]